MSTSATENRRNPAGSRPWRWVAVFVAVTVLHWLAAEWFERHHGAPPSAEKVHVPVQVRLLKTERIEQQARPAGAAQTPASKPARPAPAKRAPPPPHTLQAVAPPQPHPHPKVAAAPDTPASSADAASDASAASDALAASAATGASGTAAAKGGGNGNNPAAQAAQASHGLKFSVPPSGELQYDTFYNGVRNQPGTIHWKSDGQHYEMVVEVPLPFVGTFSWTSKGHVDPFGLAPDQYIEKRGRRPADVTVFNRDQKQIVFTRTPNSLALPDGAQDRFSMVMQLASLVRGDPETYKPGVTREFYVADNDSGESWPITTIGDETVSTDHGYVTARHFMRLPRHDGDKRRIDVWLAPALGWLPVRIMQTEPNGNEFELVWRGALVPPGGGSASNAAPDATQNAAPDAASNVAPNAVPTNASPNAAPSTPSTDMTNAPPATPATPDASSAAAPTAGGSENSNAAPTDAPAVAQPSATPESSSPATPSLPPADAPLHP